MACLNEHYYYQWLITKTAGKHCRLLSHDVASMAVYGEQETHTTDIRGGSVLVVYRDDDIEIQMRTRRIPIRDMAQFAKDCFTAAVNWQTFCLGLPFGDAAENIDK